MACADFSHFHYPGLYIPNKSSPDSAVKDCHVPARSECSYHDALLLIFSSVLQRVTMKCPTALVYQRQWVSLLVTMVVMVTSDSG